MKSKKGKELCNLLSAIAAVLMVYGLFTVLGIGCPIKFITGISCMGCGMTRAWLSVLCLDFKSAFYYHPGFWIPPLVIIYFVRLIWSDNDIVVFQPENSILSKIIQKFIFL